MRDVAPAFANTLWLASCLPEWKRFQRSLTRLAQTQTQLLKNYLKLNQDTAYGRRFRFASIESVEAYQDRVPLTVYDDYTEAIEAIAGGQPRVLTAEPVRMFEQSSGSTSASKLIPYTAGLKSEFQRGLAPWIVDAYSHCPHLIGGPAYWSITPFSQCRQTTSGGIPIGFEEDSAYLGFMGRLVDTALAVPAAVKHLSDVNTFRYVTLLFMLRRRSLRLISIWNPTFLTLLLAQLRGWWESLVDDIAHGRLTPPGRIEPELHRVLLRHVHADPYRAQALAALGPNDYQSMWPELAMISCWADGPSARYAEALAQSHFPNVNLQGKGLLATEAFISFPLIGVTGSVLAAACHFFEFLPVDQAGRVMSDQPKVAHRLERGQAYAVVVTTGGGFYRYQLQDVVEVLGFVAQTPCLRFLGKTDRVSDWFGEKLDERFVTRVLDDFFRVHNLHPTFAMLAPDDAPGGFCYTLYLELSPGQLTPEGLPAHLDNGLRQNFHYAYCRKLGQLGQPGIFLVARGAAQAYLQACQARGQKLGNIKPSVLQKTTGWSHEFVGTLLP